MPPSRTGARRLLPSSSRPSTKEEIRTTSTLGVLGFVLAVMFALAAVILRYSLVPVMHVSGTYILSVMAIAATAVLAGFRPALLATLVSALGVVYLLIPPFASFRVERPVEQLSALGLFILSGVLISWLGGNRQVALHQARETGQTLGEREAQLRGLSDHLPGAALYQLHRSTAGETRYLHMSANVQQLTGLSAEAILSVEHRLQDLILPEDLPTFTAAEEHAVRHLAPFEVEVRLRRVDGEVRWMRFAATPRVLPDAGTLWDGVQSDVTEQREAHEALEHLNDLLEQRVQERTAELVAANEALQKSNGELERFAYIASHDLQEPLRTISSFVGLLQSNYGEHFDERGHKYMSLIVSGSERMRNLVSNLLAYSRVSTAQFALQPVDTAQLLGEALGRLEALIQQAGANVTHGELPVVLGDGGQLTQLFQNLVGNAVKFARKDVTPEVHISAQREGDAWHFQVADNGIGIESQYFERLFVLFQRLHRQDQYPGTGVGLAISKKVVEGHGGQLWVESEPERGSVFHFTLPAAETSFPAHSA